MTDFILFDFLSGFFRLFYYGTVSICKKYNGVIIIYIAYGLLWYYVLFALVGAIGLITMIGILLVLTLGIVYYIIEILPHKRMREYFNKVFKDIKLMNEKNTPYFLSQEDISDYVTMYSFTCYCPLTLWRSKKDSLEMYIERKIIDIKQSEKNLSIIQLFAEIKPLSSPIPWKNEYISNDNVLNIGMGYFGMIGMDLEQYPHAFIAGETGSGKSNILKCLIYQAIHKGYEVILIDFKRGVSFADFSSEITIHYEYKDVMKVLRGAVIETTNRLDKFREVKVDNLKDYNQVVGDGDILKKKIIFIDELAELLKTRDKEISAILNDSIETLTRLSRAVGIHLIMVIQRPDSTVVGGQIKNNVGYRICGHFVDKEPSRIMLGNDMASNLQNIKGRFIVKDNDMHEIQGFYFKIPHAPNVKSTKTKKIRRLVKKDTTMTTNSDRNEATTTSNIATEKPVATNDFDFDFSEFKK